jgi:hypothetical protein
MQTQEKSLQLHKTLFYTIYVRQTTSCSHLQVCYNNHCHISSVFVSMCFKIDIFAFYITWQSKRVKAINHN